jgi:hypothetical protein
VGKLHVSAPELGLLMPFNWMTELLQYASLLVLLEVKDPKVVITDNYQVFTVGIQMMSFDLLQGLGKAIHRI